MDLREPPVAQQQPSQVPLHQHQPQQNMLLGATSYPNTTGHHSMISPNIPPTAVGSGFPFDSVGPPPRSKLPVADGGGGGLDACVFDGSSQYSAGMRFSIESGKKKRGRPRKYAPDGNIALGLAPTPLSSGTSAGHGDSGVGTPGVASSEPLAKRNRGRPPGSVKKQLDALGGVGGVGFTPHVISVKAGEDIVSKIMAFSQEGPQRTVCILSATGAICNVTLRQPAMSGGTVTYEGQFEIISLSGSFLLSENNGSSGKTGGLSVSVAGADGRVMGGGVAGTLMAASPVQVILSSFIADGKKSSSNKSKSGPSSAPPSQMLNFGTPLTTVSPPSQGPSSESSDENGSSPLDRGAGIYGNSGQPIHGMQMYQLWAAQNPQ